MEWRKDWIITFSNSEDADVEFYRFNGSESEVKNKICEMAIDKSYDSMSDLLECPETADDIKENGDPGCFYCTVGYEDYDYVFTAKEFARIDHIL